MDDRMPDPKLVVAVHDEQGHPVFVDAPPYATFHHPEAVDVAYFWGIDHVSTMPHDVGGGVANLEFPLPGGVKFGYLHFPAHSSGKLNIQSNSGAKASEYGSSPGMHRSDTLDFDVIVSGKIDLVLEGGARVTMHAGQPLIMAGCLHSWDNIYDEPCTVAVIVFGAHPKP